MSKCCDKLRIIHQIDSKKRLDHFVNYSAQNASRLTYMQVDISNKRSFRLYVNSLKQRGFINGMKKAIADIVHHCSDNDNMDERRKFCPCNGCFA